MPSRSWVPSHCWRTLLGAQPFLGAVAVIFDCPDTQNSGGTQKEATDKTSNGENGHMVRPLLTVSADGPAMMAPLAAIVPCRNEAESIGCVLDDLDGIGVARVLVCLDPASSDATDVIATERGATVVRSMSSGYDGPVLAGIAALEADGFVGRVLFLDGGNKYVMSTVGDLLRAVDPAADMTFGVRDTQLFWHQRTGNLLFSGVLFLRYRHWVRDTSSVRVIAMSTLRRLQYEDRQYSLPFQTVVHALALGLTIQYVPIRCTATRTGISKVSGSPRNSARAAREMLRTLIKRPKLRR